MDARVINIAFFGLEEDLPAGACPFRRLALWLEPGFVTLEHMTIQRMERVGIVVDDLGRSPVLCRTWTRAAGRGAGRRPLGGPRRGARRRPGRGLRARRAKLVKLERNQDSYRLCYVRGLQGIIVQLAEPIG
jgi:hypothetical protein